ncbi:MAG: sulfide/dihydroorotate dehydrogenase-like FAD/NAD-binding protein [Acidimicrobiia bacterium]
MERRFAILEMSSPASDVVRIVVEAPRAAAHAKPGQFVVIRVDHNGERIPLTICESNSESGSITLIVQSVGRTTACLSRMSEGDHLADVVGPLGLATAIDAFGACVVVAGGVGAAIMLPVAKALAASGNMVTAILGARDSDHLVLRNELDSFCESVLVTTEDGSAGSCGLVTDILSAHLQSNPVDRVFTAGPVPMMAAVAAITQPLHIPTIASLNPLMVDGTGMCGGCRVTVDGETRFACVDGPEFDAHAVDFESLERRNQAYRVFERCRMQQVPSDA